MRPADLHYPLTVLVLYDPGAVPEPAGSATTGPPLDLVVTLRPPSLVYWYPVAAARCNREGSSGDCGYPGGPADSGVDALEQRIDTAVASALEGLTLRELTGPQEPHPAVESKGEDQVASINSRTGR